ncbi:MAG: hypothetical protein WAW07_03410 [Bacteroidales bacterium]
MIRTIMFLVVCLVLFSSSKVSTDSKSKNPPVQNSPLFADFVYQGNDKVYNDFPPKPDEFYNPTELDARQWARICRDAGYADIDVITD